jgi:hypothetical protein
LFPDALAQNEYYLCKKFEMKGFVLYRKHAEGMLIKKKLD